MASKARIQALIDASPIRFEINQSYALSAEQVWDAVTETDKVGRALGAGASEFEEKDITEGVSVRHISLLGGRQSFVDEPYAWVLHQWFGNVRLEGRGPLKHQAQLTELEPIENGVRLRFQMGLAANNFLVSLIAPLLLRWTVLRSLERFYGDLEQLLDAHGQVDHPAESEVHEARLQKLRAELIQAEEPGSVVEPFIDHLRTAVDGELVHMEPIFLARRWGVNQEDLLRVFLRATQGGSLELRWSLICPSCRGPKAEEEHLHRLRLESHCSSCNIRFGARFAESVQVTFRPARALRPIVSGFSCMGGPGRTPHQIVAEQVGPGLRFQFPSISSLAVEGRLLLRCMDGSHAVELHQDETFDLSESGFSPTGAGPLAVTNHMDRTIRLLLQREQIGDEILTAAALIRRQSFRDLISGQLLASGTQVDVGSVTLLFSDLAESTRLYQEEGDAGAFAAVREHFSLLKQGLNEFDGTLVKTIGDAIMAVFETPDQALLSALRMQELMAEKSTLGLRLGIHQGPCLAVTFNENLDYFGRTVNRAARMEGQADPGEIVLSDETYHDPDVLALIDQLALPVTLAKVRVKGIEETLEIAKVKP